MSKKIIVISLGGSLIIPDSGIDIKFLKEFKQIILKHSGKKYKFIIVTGGGSIARKYISALNISGISEKLQSMIGISSTRTNARFMSYFFNQNQEEGIPQRMNTVKKYIEKRNIVFCGALEYKPNQTSDATSVEIASHFKTIFINLTDVPGLYNKNPKEYKDAKFIPSISFQDLQKMIPKTYKPGQHFVIDQTAAKLILKNKIKTYILGKDLTQLDNLLNKRRFKGTVIN